MIHSSPIPPDNPWVLIVDDHVDTVQMWTELLHLRGRNISGAYNGRDGIALAEALLPAVVFLDIAMPDMSGFDVLAKMRAIPALQETRIVALTACADPETCRRIEEAGFDDCLVKPASLSDLLKCMMTMKQS